MSTKKEHLKINIYESMTLLNSYDMRRKFESILKKRKI